MTVCLGYAFSAYPFFGIGRYHIQTRIAVIGIIMENKDSMENVSGLLHQYGQYTIERLGFPCEKGEVSIISVVVDAPQDIISALSDKLGRLQGISSKALYPNIGN